MEFYPPTQVSFTEFYEMVTGGNSPPPGLGGVGGVPAAGAGAGGGTALATTAPLGQNVVQQRNKKKQVGDATHHPALCDTSAEIAILSFTVAPRVCFGGRALS